MLLDINILYISLLGQIAKELWGFEAKTHHFVEGIYGLLILHQY